ncbi:MAG: hypothetical protein IKM25_06370 [Clostridia bacterium]|nr:hypothetical protein [Clostridia bacterium]
MKSFSKKLISILLALSMLFGCATSMGASAAASVGEFFTDFGVFAFDKILTTVIGALNLVIPDSDEIMKMKDYSDDLLFRGTETMLDEPAEGAKWKLGYGKASVVPEDWKTKDYYLGGFMSMQNGMSNKIEEVVDDMQVRVIAVDDGPGRGIAVFANIDSIGMSNYDIKNIRKALIELMPDTKFSTITVTATHVHSGVDTQGLWTNLFPKLLGNIAKNYIRIGQMTPGVDTEYMAFLTEKAAGAMKTAIEDMTEGTMKYAVKELNEDYFNNKNRPSSDSLIQEMARFTFTPDDASKKETLIVNYSAHPDIAGLAVDKIDNGRQLSGDYVVHMGKVIEEAGKNFMFFNGAIAGIYAGRHPASDGVPTDRRWNESERIGRELGTIALNLSNSEEVIRSNADWDTLNKEMAIGGDNYTLWFEDWEAATEKELDPVLNVMISEAKIRVTNPLIQLVGKLGLVNYNVYKEGLRYYIFVEVGYMEIGDVKVVLMPGEIVQDLIEGGSSLTAEGSATGKEFGLPCIDDLFGEDTLCFGLANDAIGYVVPDNDYKLALIAGHYQEMISLGKYAASSIMEEFVAIADKVA